MPVSTTNAISGPLLANGLTTTFPFTFTAPTAAEVQVISRNIATGVDTIITSGFSVTLTSGGGGSVAFDVAPATGTQIYLKLNPLFTQDVEIANGSKINAADLNRMADRAAARDQWLKHEVDRALKVAEGGVALVVGEITEGQALFRSGDRLIGQSVATLAESIVTAAVAEIEAEIGVDRDAAAASAAAAAGSESAAATSADEAAASAASAASAVLSAGTSATSTTSNTIGTGSRSFNIQTGKHFAIGQFVIAARTSAPTNFMFGQVTAHDNEAGTLTIDSQGSAGAGTFTDWTIALSGPSGSVGLLDLLTETSGTLTVARGGTGAPDAPTARTNLGATTVGSNLFTLTNPSAIAFLRLNADNTVTTRTAVQMLSDLAAAPLASPTFTGTPAAPTPAAGDNDTSIATTAFVQAELMPTLQSLASASSVTPDGDPEGDDMIVITALAANLTINAHSGAPVQGKPLIFRIKDNGTIRTLTWNAVYRAIGVTLPTATVAGKTFYIGFLYNATDSVWDCVLVRQQA